MLEAAKAALDKAGFTIEKLRNRIKELEAENEKLKESKTCDGCGWNDLNGCCWKAEILHEAQAKYGITLCEEFKPKAP
ncbi:MAG: hypothetical protein Q8M43_01275 [Sulfuricurvum sp.]|uniref:hypothetical protein n=1 Tax=Sulfuricurvum sp. TaxID=2025608 RepID=UPI00273385D2|nr:hypothetical protein [Sulfuricurvum sp.]MDP3290643.1 hypothetical protein [Sulfuricurvum sp.]